MTTRLVAFLVIALLSIPAAANGPAQILPSGEVSYVVKRNGEPIGALNMTFTREGNRLQVESDYGIEIRLLSIVLYRYQKRMSETYEDGRLVAYETTIDDNGTKSSVSVARDGGLLSIAHPEGSLTAPAGLLVTTYWAKTTVEQTQMIDSSDGVLVDVQVSAPVPEEITVDGRTLQAERYRMTGDLQRDLWYAAEDGEWLRMRMTASDGSTIEISRDWPPVWKRGLL